MRNVYVVADNIFSPLGFTTAENMQQLRKVVSGIALQNRKDIAPAEFYASLIDSEKEIEANTYRQLTRTYTRFEQMLIHSITEAVSCSNININDATTGIIISSTKGNISLIEQQAVTPALTNTVSLYRSAAKVAAYFKSRHTPIVVSNACISGLIALLTGKRLIEAGMFNHIVVAGADIISSFIFSGFQSFQAISKEPCKPFDADRSGVTLGEAASTIILSKEKLSNSSLILAGGSVSNDANHISGPSRTGEELCFAINKAMQSAGVSSTGIDFISAHGTATLYNDEMEAKAITLAGLQHTPVNSLKGYYGHTLGAAGIVESVITLQCMKENIILPTLGFNNIGVSQTINVVKQPEEIILNNCLKTASGFGGCNAALIFSKQS